MAEMTTHERMLRMYEHKEADRVPITDSPWGTTVRRWHREGLPTGVSIADYFGFDKLAGVGADNGPRLPSEVIEETDEYIIVRDSWGATTRNWKNRASVPEHIDFFVKDPDTWAIVKERAQPSRDRINWQHLKNNYKTWKEEGYWISLGFWFGFDITHSRLVGTERLLIAMIEQPEWVVDMFNHFLDVDIALFEMVLDEGYTFDAIQWPDDMGYKQAQFFSPQMYRELLKPVHKRAADWAHSKGMKVHLHSCGDIRPLVPDLIEIGIDMLNPLEVKAGMEPVELKHKYGDQLAFHGGLNALLYYDMDKMWEEMRRVIPAMKEGGGYVISSDHSVPDSVSLADFTEFVRYAKELGSYE